MFDTDVFVVGGGPAGLSAAIAARRAGFRVMLADAKQPPIDKACGEGILPDTILAASKLDIHFAPVQGHAIRGIKFQDFTTSAHADFPNGRGLGLRRTVLQGMLAERARETGVELVWGCPVVALDGEFVTTRRAQIRTRWIIGADGSQSRVRQWAGLQSFSRNSLRFSYRRHFRVSPWSDYIEIHWGRASQFYITPVNESEICLALITRDPRQRIADALSRFPVLQERLSPSEPTTPEYGAPAFTRHLRRVSQGNVALIGDASGTLDPITGQGLCLVFKQALALQHSLIHGDLELYERAHVRAGRWPRLMGDFLLLMERFSWLQRRTMRAFESKPQLFANLLSLHVDSLHPVRFAHTAAALGLRIVAP